MISFESKPHLEARSRTQWFNLASDRDSIRDVVHRFDLLLFVLHSKKVKGIPIDILDQTRTSKSNGQYDHRSLIRFAQSRFIQLNLI